MKPGLGIRSLRDIARFARYAFASPLRGSLGRDSGRGTRGSGLGIRGSGLGTRDSGLGTRDSGLGTRDSGLQACELLVGARLRAMDATSGRDPYRPQAGSHKKLTVPSVFVGARLRAMDAAVQRLMRLPLACDLSGQRSGSRDAMVLSGAMTTVPIAAP